MRPGFNVGVDPVDYEKPQSVADETLKFASQFGATDLIIQSYVEGAIRGEEKVGTKRHPCFERKG